VVVASAAAAAAGSPAPAAPAPQASAAAGETLTIYASMPLQGASRADGKAIQNGAALALQDAGGQAGGYSIKYVRLDDSLAKTGAADPNKAAQNAQQAAKDRTTIGYIGQYNSGISKVTIPMLNKAGIAQVSPSNTYVGLTAGGPGSTPGEPQKYYPTGKRTYARVVPNDRVQGRALAVAAKEAGCKSITIWDSRTTYSRGLARLATRRAKKLGLRVRGQSSINPHRPNYRRQARRIKSDCFVFTGEIESNGVQAVRDAAGAKSVRKLFAGDGMCLNDTASPRRGLPRSVARRFRCLISSLAPSAYPPPAQRVFSDYAARFGPKTAGDPQLLYGYESMALLLDSINQASAQGPVTRRAVVGQMLATTDRQSPLGTYSIDPHGDTSISDYGLYKIASGRLAFDRVVHAP
jgi:branched-chain amino acid transport system substrate-binding protein